MCEDAVEFRDHSVTTSREHEREFGNLCRYLGLDPSQRPDLEKVIDFLQRFRPCIADKTSLRDDVEDLAARWLNGEPANAIAALISGSLRHAPCRFHDFRSDIRCPFVPPCGQLALAKEEVRANSWVEAVSWRKLSEERDVPAWVVHLCLEAW
jgi:hypothetical protein